MPEINMIFLSVLHFALHMETETGCHTFKVFPVFLH